MQVGKKAVCVGSEMYPECGPALVVFRLMQYQFNLTVKLHSSMKASHFQNKTIILQCHLNTVIKAGLMKAALSKTMTQLSKTMTHICI